MVFADFRNPNGRHVLTCPSRGKHVTEYTAAHGLGVRAMYDGKKALVNKGVLHEPAWAGFNGCR